VSLLRPRPPARHARRSVLAPLLVAGGLATALVAVDGALVAGSAHANQPPTVENFDRLAQCESGGRWNINTGNGYYGGLQFSAATWRSVGYGGLPHQASREVQIQAGQKLQARSGWGQWPACSRKLGLRGGGGVTAAAAPPPAPAPAPARASRARTAPAGVAQVPFGGDVSTAASRTARADVRAWQAQMKKRGWRIGVDGRFGPQSAGVAQRFAAQKGLPVTPGTLNGAVYNAAWTLPV
jgi:resuscitation-promoting factor RpfA